MQERIGASNRPKQPEPRGGTGAGECLPGSIVDVRGNPALTSLVPGADLTNVVLFHRATRGPQGGTQAHPAPEIVVPERSAITVTDRRHALRFAALFVLSFAAHAVWIYGPFQEEPVPMASIGEVSVSVDLVLGGKQDAGLTHDRGDAEVTAPAAVAQDPDPAPDQPPTEKPTELAEAKPPAELKPVAPVMPTPERPPAPALMQAAPLMAVPAELTVSVNPTPPTEVAETPPETVPVETITAQTHDPAREQRRRSAERGERSDQPVTTAATLAAGGAGRGRSDADSNYFGRLVAHLVRQQRFPQEARNRGLQGVATVAFSLDESGQVTAATLHKSSGVASLDHEATAMVQRASPFPAPPGGRAMSFTVPVSFKLRGAR